MRRFRFKTKADKAGDGGGKMTTRKAFEVFDTDGSGSLSIAELRTVLARPSGGAALSDDEIKAIISEWDVDGDGEIQYEEFVKMWGGEEEEVEKKKSGSSGAGKAATGGGGSSSAKGAASASGRGGGGGGKAANGKVASGELEKLLKLPAAAQAFKNLDVAGTGMLDVASVQSAIRRASDGKPPLTDADVAAKLIAPYTDRGDGAQLSLAQFTKLMDTFEASPPHLLTLYRMRSLEKEYIGKADAEIARRDAMPTLMTRLGDVLRKKPKTVEDLAREWDANGDGSVSKMEFRQSLRNPKLGLGAENVEELDSLFARLDKDGGGSLDLNELKLAMKVMSSEAANVERAMGVATAQAEHFRARAALMGDSALTCEELQQAELRLLETRIMLGKEAPPKPGEKISGALSARLYATMVKRGIKITEVANNKHGRIDRKEFRMTISTLIPAALISEVDAMFDSFDIDAGGTLDVDEFRALLYSLRDKATDAGRQEAMLQARAALLHLACKASQEIVSDAIKADERAAADAKEAQQKLEQQRAEEKEKAKAAKAAKAAEKAQKEQAEKAALEARVAARRGTK